MALTYKATLAKIESGQIDNSQIGNAPLWIIGRHRGLRRGQILVPNVTDGIFYVLKDMFVLLRQQGHIIDGYEKNEIPQCGSIFEVLVNLSQNPGLQDKLTSHNRLVIALKLSDAASKIRGSAGGKAEAKEELLQAIEDCIQKVNSNKIRDRVENAIRFLIGRMEQIGTSIGPLIERRRSAAFYYIAQEERQLWRIAHTLRTRINTTEKKNIATALERDLESMRIPKAQPFRQQVMSARTLTRSAIASIKVDNPTYASRLLFCAIDHLGFEPKTLKPKPRIESPV